MRKPESGIKGRRNGLSAAAIAAVLTVVSACAGGGEHKAKQDKSVPTTQAPEAQAGTGLGISEGVCRFLSPSDPQLGCDNRAIEPCITLDTDSRTPTYGANTTLEVEDHSVHYRPCPPLSGDEVDPFPL